MEKEQFPQIYMFAQSVKDFRTGNHMLYSSTSIVFMALVGILCGASSWEEIELVCQKQIGKRTSCYEFASESSTGHSREEERSCFMCNFISWLPKCGNEWPGIKTFGCITTVVKIPSENTGV